MEKVKGAIEKAKRDERLVGVVGRSKTKFSSVNDALTKMKNDEVLKIQLDKARNALEKGKVVAVKAGKSIEKDITTMKQDAKEGRLGTTGCPEEAF